MVTRFVVNYYILPIDANASARQNVVITTFCNVTTFWVVTTGRPGGFLARICFSDIHAKWCHFRQYLWIHVLGYW